MALRSRGALPLLIPEPFEALVWAITGQQINVRFAAKLKAAPPEEAMAALQRLRGIGRWTAEYLLLRGFGQRGAFPAGDGGLKRAAGHWYGLGRLASEAEVRAIGAAWAPWRGYAALHWWFARQQGLTADAPAGGAKQRRGDAQHRNAAGRDATTWTAPGANAVHIHARRAWAQTGRKSRSLV